MPAITQTNIRKHINRNLRGMDRLELWLISAIVTILVVRLFLELTGYPQVGDSTLHVAHVLWGGLLMAVGTIVLFTFLGKQPEALGTLAAGIGFGLFIDEVGKFVTQSNDYFFQPSVAIMYTVFVILYMGARWIMTSSGYTRTEYLVNSINEMRELPVGQATEEERKRIFFALGKSDADDPLVRELKQIMRHVNPSTEGRQGLFVRWRDSFYAWYRRRTENKWFSRAIAGFFILEFISSASVVLAIMFDPGEVVSQLEGFGFADWAILASNIISAFYITWGVLLLRRSRLGAYKMFERALLVQIFLGQLFLFYKDEFGAIPGFIFYLLLLLAIRFIIQRENSEMIGAAIASAEAMD